jgi:peptide/nickel transport system permease protein
MSASPVPSTLPSVRGQDARARARGSSQVRGRRGVSSSTLKIVLGSVLVGSVVALILLSLVYVPFDPNAQSLSDRLSPPSVIGGGEHLLGTDHLGRDVLSRLMAGGRVSLAVAAVAIIVTNGLGTIIGLVAAYYGRWVDAALTMLAEIQLSLPSILIIIVFLALIGPSVLTVALVIALSDWVVYARTMRARALVEKERDYVTAARALGAKDGHIIFRHLFPNTLPTLIVLSTVQLGSVILLESALGYLGLGVQRPNPSWGRMVADGQAYIASGWWISLVPALTIGIVVLGASILGDGLRQRWKME